MPWMWSWKQQLNRKRSCCRGEKAQKRTGEILVLFTGAELWVCKSGLGAAIPGLCPGPAEFLKSLEHHPCSGILILLLVCGCDQMEEAGAAIQPCPTLSWTFQANSEPEDCTPWIQRAWLVWAHPPYPSWADWWPVLKKKAGTNPECDVTSQGTERKPPQQMHSSGRFMPGSSVPEKLSVFSCHPL